MNKLNSRAYSNLIAWRLLAVIGVIVIGTAFSCATSNYGSLRSSAEITNMFESGQIPADYSYYFSGFQSIPDAIVGIHPNYFLRSKVWKQIDLDSTTLENLIYRMKTVYLSDPRGALILAPDGQQVGIWFSSEYQTSVRLENNNQLVVVPPQPLEVRGMP